VSPDPGGAFDGIKVTGFGWLSKSDKVSDWIAGWRKALQALAHGGRLFRLGVVTALALCNHSLTLTYVDVSMRRHCVKIK
jgi:hypothetical protein